jgi:hypothetical protein
MRSRPIIRKFSGIVLFSKLTLLFLNFADFWGQIQRARKTLSWSQKTIVLAYLLIIQQSNNALSRDSGEESGKFPEFYCSRQTVIIFPLFPVSKNVPKRSSWGVNEKFCKKIEK